MAREMVRAPRRPKNIRIVITIFPERDKKGVIPRESPTVPNAETASKEISIRECTSEKLSMIIQPITKTMEKRKITIDRFSTVNGIFFLNNSTRFLPLMTDQTPATRIPAVVVFIPPPVEPGDAPINIRIMKKRAVGMEIAAVSKVLNPAVLVVTD